MQQGGQGMMQPGKVGYRPQMFLGMRGFSDSDQALENTGEGWVRAARGVDGGLGALRRTGM